jgi:hypothetical protein
MLGLLCLTTNAGIKVGLKKAGTNVEEKIDATQFTDKDGILDLQKIGNSKLGEKFAMVLDGKSFLGSIKVLENTPTYVKVIGVFDTKDGGFGLVFQKETLTGNASFNDIEYVLALNKDKGGVYFKKKENKEDRG